MGADDSSEPEHPVLIALDDIGMGWLKAFAEQGFEDIAGVVRLSGDTGHLDALGPQG